MLFCYLFVYFHADGMAVVYSVARENGELLLFFFFFLINFFKLSRVKNLTREGGKNFLTPWLRPWL